jgi:HEAT repeat protein
MTPPAPSSTRPLPHAAGSTSWSTTPPPSKPATPTAVAALSRAIKDPDLQARFSAALSLAQIGPAAEAAVPALRDALHDENRYVPGYAVEALERIATPDAMQVLLPFLKTARWCAHTSPASIY